MLLIWQITYLLSFHHKFWDGGQNNPKIGNFMLRRGGVSVLCRAGPYGFNSCWLSSWERGLLQGKVAPTLNCTGQRQLCWSWLSHMLGILYEGAGQRVQCQKITIKFTCDHIFVSNSFNQNQLWDCFCFLRKILRLPGCDTCFGEVRLVFKFDFLEQYNKTIISLEQEDSYLWLTPYAWNWYLSS